MMKTIQLAVASTVVMFAMTARIEAGIIRAPTTISTGTLGVTNGAGTILGMTNQSGLSGSYTSGVDDFATITTSTTSLTHTSSDAVSWLSANSQTTGVITFDLGSIFSVQAVALWMGASGPTAHLNSFNIFSNRTNDFGSSTSIGGGNNPQGAAQNQQNNAAVFALTPTDARFVFLQVVSNHGSSSFTSIGEIAFDTSSAAAVPEPSSLAVFGIGACVAGVGAARRRRKKQQSTA